MPIQLILILSAVAIAAVMILRPGFLRRLVPDRDTIVDMPRRAVFGSNRLLDDVVRQAERSTFRVGPKVYMPDDVLIEANPDDFAVEPSDFAHFCSERLQARASELGYTYAARLKVLAVSDAKLRPGRPVVSAKVTTGTTLIGDAIDDGRPSTVDTLVGFALTSRDDRWGSFEVNGTGQSIVLGSSKQQSDVRLDHKAISGRHAELRLDDSVRLQVRDLESTNGTFVGGQRLPSQVWTDLVPGDVLGLGPAGHDLPEWKVAPRA